LKSVLSGWKGMFVTKLYLAIIQFIFQIIGFLSNAIHYHRFVKM